MATERDRTRFHIEHSDENELISLAVAHCVTHLGRDLDGRAVRSDGSFFNPVRNLDDSFFVLNSVMPNDAIGLWFSLDAFQSPGGPRWAAFIGGARSEGPSPMVAICKACLIFKLGVAKSTHAFDKTRQ